MTAMDGLIRSGQSNIGMSCGFEPFLVGEVAVADGSHEGPVVADRAVLEPGDSEIERLELHARDPDRGEQMARSAPDHDTPADLVSKAASNQGAHDQYGDRHYQETMIFPARNGHGH